MLSLTWNIALLLIIVCLFIPLTTWECCSHGSPNPQALLYTATDRTFSGKAHYRNREHSLIHLHNQLLSTLDHNPVSVNNILTEHSSSNLPKKLLNFFPSVCSGR